MVEEKHGVINILYNLAVQDCGVLDSSSCSSAFGSNFDSLESLNHWNMHFNIEACFRTVPVYGDVQSTQQTVWHLV